MLVLSRKPKEYILIGDNVRVYVIKICGERVHLGVEAPRNVSVYRGEVYAARQAAEKDGE